MANKEVQTRIAQFQDDLNKVIKSSVWYEDGKSHGWEDTVIERYYGNFKKDIAALSHDEKKMLFDKKVLDKLSKDIELIVKGKLDELTKPTQEVQLLVKKYEREDWDLRQDQAFSKMLDEMTGQGEYARLLGNIIKMIVGKL